MTERPVRRDAAGAGRPGEHANLATTGEPLPSRVDGRARWTDRSSWSPAPGWAMAPLELHKIDMLFRGNRLPLESGRA
ncbi:hypothetical protein [Streptomyces sp. NPDC088736]|uniref:hypothetical protein n=1 Tax=Streptomyces sp. NPDC088736 TaxID=3365881 RepID=UPI00380FCB53